jgi:hypothetical protein
MTELKTKPFLLMALQKASLRGPTEEEARMQRVSFVMSCIKDSTMTRQRVEQVLNKQEGRRIAF